MRQRARSEQYRARAASRYGYRAQLIIESKLQHVPVRASGSHRQISSSGLWFRSLHGGPRQRAHPRCPTRLPGYHLSALSSTRPQVQPPYSPPHHHTSLPLPPPRKLLCASHCRYLARLTTPAALLLASVPRPRCHAWQFESSAARLIIGLCAQFLLLIILPITSAARTACAFLNNPVAI
jgi:hypothetical protein